MSIRDELQDLRNLLGEEGFVNAIWAMRYNAMGPMPKPHLKGWRYRRPDANNVLHFTGAAHGLRGTVQTKG